jgi:hypothetical protein
VHPFADLALARRLERAEGLANARCVEARALRIAYTRIKWRQK